jgi:polygalacturonase
VKTDATHNDADVLNSLIQQASERSVPATVIVDRDCTLTKTVHLRSNVHLFFDNVTLAVQDTGNFEKAEQNDSTPLGVDRAHRHLRNAVLLVEHAQNVKIYGYGVLDGGFKSPAKFISIYDSRNITLEGFKIIARETRIAIILKDVDRFLLRNLGISSRNDAINLADVKNGEVIDTFTDSWNDGLCFKSYPYLTTRELGNYSISVRGGEYTSHNRSGMKWGREESYGDSWDIHVSDVTLSGRKAGLTFRSRNGSTYKDITFSDIRIRESSTSILMDMSPKKVENIVFNGLSAPSDSTALFATGTSAKVSFD